MNQKLYTHSPKRKVPDVFFKPFQGLAFAILFLVFFSGCSNISSEKVWLGTWATANMPFDVKEFMPEGLSDVTWRQIVCVSVGGEKFRVKFSNEFSEYPLELKTVQIAVSNGGSEIDESSVRNLTFDGNPGVVMDPGSVATSDPVYFDLNPRTRLAVTINFGETSTQLACHAGSRTTSYLLPKDSISEGAGFSNAKPIDLWFVVKGIDVEAPESSGAIAIIGNSITDGRGSGTNKQNRWTDILAERLTEQNNDKPVGVLNLGIGGNCVLKDGGKNGGIGPSALNRFKRDILGQEGVRWLIIMEGVNDIGEAKDSFEAEQVVKDLFAAYDSMINIAHNNDMKVYGVTILPFKGSFYFNDFRENARSRVNNWIRSSGHFDAVIDFDEIIRDPENPVYLLPEMHMGDYLHPNELGYQTMGEAVDLSLFQ